MDRQRHSDPAGLKCPKCGSSDIRRSRVDGIRDSVMRALGRWPFRCRSCRVKFFKAGMPPPDDEV